MARRYSVLQNISELNNDGDNSYDRTNQEKTSLENFMQQKFEINMEIVAYKFSTNVRRPNRRARRNTLSTS